MAENTNMQEKYWKSLNSLHGDTKLQEARHHEFGDGVKDEFNPDANLSGLSRRKFLALVGASAAFATAGCSNYPDKGEVVPYTRKPEEITLGIANYYASTCSACESACGILVKTREGRPIKVDGNPDHPVNLGKICGKGQASVLNLYDPSRLVEPFLNQQGFKKTVSWNMADIAILQGLKNAGTKEVALVTAPVVSPSFAKIIEEFSSRYPTTKVYSYKQFNDAGKIAAWEKTHGNRQFPAILWDKAKTIVTLEGDFLGVESDSVGNTVKFSKTRNVDNLQSFSRLYAIESNLSLTGMQADYRLRLTPDKQFGFVIALLAELAKKGVTSSAGNALLAAVRNTYTMKDFGFAASTIHSLVEDLTKQGTAIVYGGRMLDERTHIAINILNDAIGAAALMDAAAGSVGYYPDADISAMQELTGKLNAGQVAVVIHIDTNPVFTLPANMGYKAAIAKAGISVTLTEFENETSAVSMFTLPINHDFESWGDVKVKSHVFSMKQPVIAPLYRTRQKEAALLMWAKGSEDGFSQELYLNYLKNHWQTSIYPTLQVSASFDAFWNSLLHDGVFVQKGSAGVTAATFPGIADANVRSQAATGMSLLITESFALSDGKFAHNGWLQELAHPVTKVTWDNCAAISYATSKKLGVVSNDVVEISVEGRKIEVPVVVQPGLADDFIAIDAGYGREVAPVVALEVGVNVNTLMHAKNGGKFYLTGVTVNKTGKVKLLATTQDHHTYDEELIKDLHKHREIIREGTVEEYKKHPLFLKAETKPVGENMYPEFQYTEAKWAMAIDLNKCTGCGDCVVACSVENNVPVVGQDQVLLSREMQWLRIDRYYSGTPENPHVSVQPMLCQHCDNAPCENVCPVVATNHSPDGLNQMVYNRCVGTRYCSNNCPYKVRRFNFYNFRDHFENGHYTQPVMQLAANPEVTIRSRGVMEKCTFCVHRIMDARAQATKDGKTFDGAGITTACQDSCSANAIVFGNANDPESQISKLRSHNLGYSVLEEINVKPNVTYIAKLRNTQSEEV